MKKLGLGPKMILSFLVAIAGSVVICGLITYSRTKNVLNSNMQRLDTLFHICFRIVARNRKCQQFHFLISPLSPQKKTRLSSQKADFPSHSYNLSASSMARFTIASML